MLMDERRRMEDEVVKWKKERVGKCDWCECEAEELVIGPDESGICRECEMEYVLEEEGRRG